MSGSRVYMYRQISMWFCEKFRCFCIITPCHSVTALNHIIMCLSALPHDVVQTFGIAIVRCEFVYTPNPRPCVKRSLICVLLLLGMLVELRTCIFKESSNRQGPFLYCLERSFLNYLFHCLSNQKCIKKYQLYFHLIKPPPISVWTMSQVSFQLVTTKTCYSFHNVQLFYTAISNSNRQSKKVS